MQNTSFDHTHVSRIEFDQAASGPGLAWVCMRGDELIWSSGVYELLGLLPFEFEPSLQLFLSFVHPDDRGIRGVLESGRQDLPRTKSLFRVMRRDGSLRLLSLATLEAADGETPKPICLIDVTGQFEPLTDGESNQGFTSEFVSEQGILLLLDQGPAILSSSARNAIGATAGEQVTLSSFLRQVDEGDRALIRAAVDPSSAAVTPKFRLRLRRLDNGEVRNFEFGPTRPLNAGTRRIGTWAALVDVTSEVERERERVEYKTRFETLLENIRGGAAIVHRSGTIHEANRVAVDILSARPGQMLTEVHPGLARDPLVLSVAEVLDGRPKIEEERFVPALEKWVSYGVTPLEADTVLITLQSKDDVYRLRAAVEDMALRCERAFAIGFVGAWDYDETSKLIWFAPAAREFLGITTYSLEEFRTRIHPDDLAEFDAARVTALERREPFEIDFRFNAADGRERRLRSRGGFVAAPFDSRKRLAGVVIDLSNDPALVPSARMSPDQELTGAQVRAARGALRWSVRELSEFSSVSVATINRFESDAPSVTTRTSSVRHVAEVLQTAGIGFHLGPTGNPAIEIGPERRMPPRRG